jgi:hypothetical protein
MQGARRTHRLACEKWKRTSKFAKGSVGTIRHSPRNDRHWQPDSCRGLRHLIAPFDQNMITVLSETTHV